MKLKIALIVICLMGGTALAQQRPPTKVGILERVDIGSAPTTLRDGMEWRVGDTVFIRNNGITRGIILGGGTDGQVLVLDSAAGLVNWATIVTDSASAASVSFSNIANATGHSTHEFGSYKLIMNALTLNDNVSQFEWYGYGGNSVASLFNVHTESPSGARAFQATARGGANGVYLDSTAKFTYMGSGTIDANLWKGLTVIPSANLDAQIAYKNVANTFVGPQTATATGVLSGFQATAVTGNAISGTATGLGNGVLGAGNSGGGTGVAAQSINGIALLALSTSGTIADFYYGITEKAKIDINGVHTVGIRPLTGSDATVSPRGDGTWVYELHKQGAYAANDTITFTGIPTGKTWAFSFGVVGKPTVMFTPGFEVVGTTLYVSSSNAGMEGIEITVSLFEQN